MSWLKSHYLFNLLFTLFVIGLGVFQAFNLPVSLYPEVDKPTIRVIIPLLEDSESFYRQWGNRIEESLGAIENVEHVEGTYTQGRATIYVKFEWSISPKAAKQEVSTVAAFYQAQLPNIWPTIRVDFSDPGSENYIAFTSDRYSASKLSEILKLNLLPKLEAIEGVGSAWVSDKELQFLQVEVFPYSLIESGVSFEKVELSLQKHAYNEKLGLLKTTGDGKLTVILASAVKNLEQLKGITIKATSGQAIKLSEVADVYWAQEPSSRAFLYNDTEVIAVAIWPEPGANIYDVSAEFLQEVEQFAKTVGDFILLNTPVDFIEESIFNILLALCLGMFTAACVVFLFYRKISNTLIVSCSMPAGLSISCLVMYVGGVGINLISLGAMTIAIGMVVDGSIIAVDKINSKLSELPSSASMESKLNYLILAVDEVKQPIISSTLTTIIVFLPLAFTEPFISSILGDTVWVTVSILFASIYLSLIAIPSIYVFFLKGYKEASSPRSADTVEHQATLLSIGSVYNRRVLTYISFLCSNSVRKLIILMSTVLFVVTATILLVSKVRQEVIAQPLAEIIDIDVTFNREGLDKPQKLAYITPIKKQIMDLVGDHIEYVYTDVRQDNAYLSLHLKSYRNFDDVLEKLKQAVSDESLPDVGVEPWITSSLKIKEAPALRLFVNAANEGENRLYLASISNFVKQHQAVKRTKEYPKNSKTKLVHFEYNADLIDPLLSGQDYESSLEQLNNFIKHSLEPQKVYEIDLGSGLHDIKLKISTDALSARGILQLPYESHAKTVFIDQLIDVSTVDAWREFFSINARKSYSLELWTKPEVTAAGIESLKLQIKKHLVTEHGLVMVPVTFEDSGRETRQALMSIKNALLFSVFLIFLVLLFQFNSLSLAVIAISAAPLGVCGAIIALYLFDSTLSLNSILGMLILAGLSVNNSIFLLDAFERAIARGFSQLEAISQSVSSRMRSLIVTNLTTVVGMLPLVIGFGPGKDILQPLGISVSFGLIFAALSSLVIIPILLSYPFALIKNSR